MAANHGLGLCSLLVIVLVGIMSRTVDAGCPFAHRWKPTVPYELSWLSRSLLQQAAPKVCFRKKPVCRIVQTTYAYG
jgi:hypothetical protein